MAIEIAERRVGAMSKGRIAMANASMVRRVSEAGSLLRAAALASAVAVMCLGLPGAAAAEGFQTYKLAPGDRIAVTVFGQAELSGEIQIDGEGNINVPFIGSIAVKGLTIGDCQKTITERLADGILAKPAVSVRVIELRPIYVLGDVHTPGAYPYRYGGTVKSAVAAAGGFGLPDAVQSAAVSDYYLADERFRELDLQRKALLVRRARLEAQRDGAEKFTPPASLGAEGDGDAAETVAIERETFDSQAAVMKTQIDQMRAQKPRLLNEIDAVNGQIAVEKKQVEIIRHESDQYAGLMKQGLGLANADTQLKLEETTRESDIWRLEAEISRLQMDSGDLEIKIQEVEVTFKKQVIADLLDTQQKLKELEVTLQSARAIRAFKLQQAGNPALQQPGSVRGEFDYNFNVTREQDGKENVIDATETTSLEPGDVVEVKKSASRAAAPNKAADADLQAGGTGNLALSR
jgi:polysaccharide biosynthesis/export protein